MPPSGPGLSRRTVLAGGLTAGSLLAAGAVACRDDEQTAPPIEGADLLAAALADEDELLALYAEAITADPAAATLLTSLRDDHRVHRDALLAAGAPSPSAAASASVLPSRPPRRPAAARGVLRTAESAASRARAESCRQAPKRLAPLLGSLAASEATHIAVLRTRA